MLEEDVAESANGLAAGWPVIGRGGVNRNTIDVGKLFERREQLTELMGMFRRIVHSCKQHVLKRYLPPGSSDIILSGCEQLF